MPYLHFFPLSPQKFSIQPPFCMGYPTGIWKYFPSQLLNCQLDLQKHKVHFQFNMIIDQQLCSRQVENRNRVEFAWEEKRIRELWLYVSACSSFPVCNLGVVKWLVSHSSGGFLCSLSLSHLFSLSLSLLPSWADYVIYSF